ncbi:Hypothetical predicted protein [Marmota monax]|uniref:Uncharacterized protein n=1 Tax=Marmota monax TaxID=9995 RepID=A0A5E4C2J9_MARMO|nr:hypothetical protein GHT09_012140 [Marmota monax]VTJ76107.1 Hypothetical predicted protein [Marmota monax]
MGNGMNKILPGLYIGNFKASYVTTDELCSLVMQGGMVTSVSWAILVKPSQTAQSCY